MKLPDPFDVPYTEGPDCPICQKKIVLQCTVLIKKAHVRTAGGDHFSTKMTADLVTEVIAVTADHGCAPKKEERR